MPSYRKGLNSRLLRRLQVIRSSKPCFLGALRFLRVKAPAKSWVRSKILWEAGMKMKMHETTRRLPQSRWGGIAALALIALFVYGAPFTHAQNRTLGELRGTITDSTQAQIPGATVDILNQDTRRHTIIT